MELWIRSQDKEKLCKIHDLCVHENQNENNETNYVIQDIYTMGTYKTKERALEVLDEIQKLLTPKIIIKNEGRDCVALDGTIYRTNIVSNINSDIQQLSTYVYEMPKE